MFEAEATSQQENSNASGVKLSVVTSIRPKTSYKMLIVLRSWVILRGEVEVKRSESFIS